MFSVISQNTAGQLSLHDCCCARMYYEDDKLIFDIDWMEVLKDHPNNPYPEAHQSGQGRIELLSPVLSDAQLQWAVSNNSPETVDITAIDYEEVEFLTFAEGEEQTGYRAEVYAIFNNSDQYDSIRFFVSYSSSIVMWNELNGFSWFENEIWKREKQL